MGLGFWHPMSEMPEQGFCEFPTYEEAQKYIDFLCSDKCAAPMTRTDFTIEMYDREQSDRMQAEYLEKTRK